MATLYRLNTKKPRCVELKFLCEVRKYFFNSKHSSSSKYSVKCECHEQCHKPHLILTFMKGFFLKKKNLGIKQKASVSCTHMQCLMTEAICGHPVIQAGISIPLSFQHNVLFTFELIAGKANSCFVAFLLALFP